MGVNSVVLGMPHRGRCAAQDSAIVHRVGRLAIQLLFHVVDKPKEVKREFRSFVLVCDVFGGTCRYEPEESLGGF